MIISISEINYLVAIFEYIYIKRKIGERKKPSPSPSSAILIGSRQRAASISLVSTPPPPLEQKCREQSDELASMVVIPRSKERERDAFGGDLTPPPLSKGRILSLSLPRECASVRVFRVLQAWRRDLELGRYLNNKYKRAGSPSLMAGWCEIEEGGGAGYGATAAYIGRVKDGAKRERGREREGETIRTSRCNEKI